ncbi:hypothetical protein BDR26DRAFT_867597 [Obelidium mucronatum]|nr:hypothetical protein BDR26DRAFT_867597 [Obelidium mucronatum]
MVTWRTHHPNPNQSSSSSEEDVTKTPRKKRRVSDEFIADENIGADDDLSVAQTPVPHGIHGHGGIHQELGQKGFSLSHGINEDVKELMRVVKREISQLVHCVSHIKTWTQLDSIHVPKCNIQEEITGIEKWGMETLESFPAYHAKRGQLLRDYVTASKTNDGAPQDLKEAVLELDDVQMQHLIMTLQEAMQISAVLYTHLDGVVVEDV